MTVLPVASKLETLIEYLDGLTSRAPVAELKTRLAGLGITVEDVADYVHFGQDRYLRNLVHEGDWYHVLAICWRSGQRSPIHNHAGSTCGLCVLAGVATETIFERTPSGLIQAVSSHDWHTGDVAASQDADIHQVSNLQEAGTDLVTLHVYSPPLFRMDTYSLTDATIGEFRPMVLEHAAGSGI
ncbi:MAG: cysteine dioxygenase family protein [Planctomycetes bacterium]|nr:cysteine dioxygenase family protein [Planctomycetota bacterium]